MPPLFSFRRHTLLLFLLAAAAFHFDYAIRLFFDARFYARYAFLLRHTDFRCRRRFRADATVFATLLRCHSISAIDAAFGFSLPLPPFYAMF